MTSSLRCYGNTDVSQNYSFGKFHLVNREVTSLSELFRLSISHPKLGGCHLEKSS